MHAVYLIQQAPIPQNGDPWKTTERPKIGKVFQQSPRSVKFAVSVEWLRKPLKDHWKTKNNFSSKIPVGPWTWRQLKVYWETNKTIQLRDHWKIIWHTARDLWKINQDLWKTDRDHWKNSERLTKTPERTLKDWPRLLQGFWKNEITETVERWWKD